VCYVGPRYSAKDYAVAKRPFPETPAADSQGGMQFYRLPSLPMPLSPTGQSRFVVAMGTSYALLQDFKPDIIHTQSPYGVGAEAKRAARKFGVPLVGTNHTAIEDFFPFGMRTIMRHIDARYYNHCDFVTTPYQTLIDRMREAGFTRPAKPLANPVELEHFTPPMPGQKEALRQTHNLQGPVVLYVGRLGIEKYVDVVVRGVAELVKQFPTITLVATGHGAAEPSLRRLVAQLGIEKNVRFVGFLERAVLADMYKVADAFAFMSTSDSQSISLMQAYATGVPAVCARARGLPDFTPQRVGFLVEPGDHHALAAHLHTLLSDQNIHDTMGKAAIEFVSKLSPSHIADQWEEVYKAALGK
jgi:1,2-diacylglycerol 3-alpha-glucosyltransferase